MATSQARIDAIKASANALAEHLDTDILILNAEIYPPGDFVFIRTVGSRNRRSKVLLFLTTEGGSADSAFRMMRFLQARYQRVTVAVGGWCKSAGTLMCIGAHQLVMGDAGELGPLDVQIVKADEMNEQKSGLVAEAAFEKLQLEAFKFFIGFVRNLGDSGYRVTLKTASDIATKMTIGVVQPIFDKMEPVTIGEDYRSNRLALSYATRLNVHSRNLKRTRELDALDNLLSGYDSHGFVIDLKEASNLFINVAPYPPEMLDLVDKLGMDIVLPREQGPRLEYLNDEPPTAKASVGASQNPVAPPGGAGNPRRRNRSGKLSGNSPERGNSEPVTRPNGSEPAK
ncbi:SDH family Clp fold serine proteinase [Mesorhizobium loti]|nr:hypothetical protein [Mesorhizobium loti]OBQ59113.1 hypothetical protein A8145_26085 [Mesorhizobium loti]QKC73299.1 hypothetical protein EB815_32470 [Mesorhizobium loti]